MSKTIKVLKDSTMSYKRHNHHATMKPYKRSDFKKSTIGGTIKNSVPNNPLTKPIKIGENLKTFQKMWGDVYTKLKASNVDAKLSDGLHRRALRIVKSMNRMDNAKFKIGIRYATASLTELITAISTAKINNDKLAYKSKEALAKIEAEVKKLAIEQEGKYKLEQAKHYGDEFKYKSEKLPTPKDNISTDEGNGNTDTQKSKGNKNNVIETQVGRID